MDLIADTTSLTPLLSLVENREMADPIFNGLHWDETADNSDFESLIASIQNESNEQDVIANSAEQIILSGNPSSSEGQFSGVDSIASYFAGSFLAFTFGLDWLV